MPTKKYRAKVRMYRHGLGDCFLVTLPASGGKRFHMVIDCGVILGTDDAGGKMEKVVADLEKETKGKIDVLAVTHEHWDHVSGFLQVDDWKDRFTIKEVWFGWTENPEDELARELDRYKEKALALLMTAAGHMRLAGMGAAAEVDSILGFYGVGSGDLGVAATLLGANSTRDARDKVRELAPVRYRMPGEDPLAIISAKGPRVFVLGPPHDAKQIKRYAPSKAHPETYEFGASDPGEPLGRAFRTYDEDAPFGLDQRIPLDQAKGLAFFKEHYWGRLPLGGKEESVAEWDSQERDANAALRDQGWRRIDDAWLGVSPDLALKLDSATNNTSLVLAIELEPGGDVLLFAGDAQVGNWLSWHDVKWEEDGKTVTGTDLVKRTLIYKVGHHGSHNATLKEKGLELMDNPGLIALVPVDHDKAVDKGWDKIPRESLMKRLHEKAHGRVLRSDDPQKPTASKPPKGVDGDAWKAFVKQVKTSRSTVAATEGGDRPLWYEITV